MNRRMKAKLEGMARAIFENWFVDFGEILPDLVYRPLCERSPRAG